MKKKQAKQNAKYRNFREQMRHLKIHMEYALTLRVRSSTPYTRFQIARTARLINDIIEPIQNRWYKRLGVNVGSLEALTLDCITKQHDDFIANNSMFQWAGVEPGRLLSRDVCRAYRNWLDALSDHFQDDLLDEATPTCEQVNGELWHQDYLSYCDACEEYHTHAANMASVITALRGHHTEQRCDDERNATWCDISDEYYCDSEFSFGTTRSGQTICSEWAEHNNWTTDRHGEYYDLDNDSDDDNIPDAGDGMRDKIDDALRDMQDEVFTHEFQRRIGLEVELDFPSESRREAFYDNNRSVHCIELDGSLHEEAGAELVSPPYTLKDWRDEGNSFLKFIRRARDDYGAVGWRNRHTYGVHVNVDLRGLDAQQMLMFFVAVNHLAPLYCTISGRDYVYTCSSDDSYHTIQKPAGQLSVDYLNQRLRCSVSHKYQAVRMDVYSRMPMAEVRAFGSNLREGALLEYIELVYATVAYAKHLSKLPTQQDLFDSAFDITGDDELYNRTTSSFLTWLNSHNRYPAIASRIKMLGITPQSSEYDVRSACNSGA